MLPTYSQELTGAMNIVMGWRLGLRAGRYAQGMTVAIRSPDELMLEAVAESGLDLDPDYRTYLWLIWLICIHRELLFR